MIFRQEHKYDLKIGLNIYNVWGKANEDFEVMSSYPDMRIDIWTTNNGFIPGSFTFVAHQNL